MSGEASLTFDCFGSTCSVHVIGDGLAGTPEQAVAWARGRLLAWHHQFSRFEPDSELSRLNANDSPIVHVSHVMARLAKLVADAWLLTSGLVDGTMTGAIERAGYSGDLGRPLPLRAALANAPARQPAAGNPGSGAAHLDVDVRARTVARPAGVRLDSGGLAKGLFCDILADTLESHAAFAVDCAGDVRLGGHGGFARELRVASPFGDEILHAGEHAAIAAATSGIGKRSWLDGEGNPAHHLLDPSSGRPAFTGLVQVTALAPKASVAEVCAKAALLSGPEGARRWLPDGGLLVHDDGGAEAIAATGTREWPTTRQAA